MTASQLAALLHRKSAFLFDLDGTLVDSSSCHERAYHRALRQIRPDLEPGFSYERYKGWRTRDTFQDLGVGDEIQVAALTEAKQRNYLQEVETGRVDLLPQAQELLEALKRQGCRAFLVTGASRRSTDAVLSHLRLTHLFEGVITGDDIVHSKPAPDSYVECVVRMQIPPQKAIVIEDAPSGVQSAHAAGLDVIAVNNPGLAGTPEYVGTLFEILCAIEQTQYGPYGLKGPKDQNAQ